MSQIRISDQVKGQLDSLKRRNGHSSFDSLVRFLLATPCKEPGCIWYWNCMEYGCPTFEERTREEKA